MTRVHNFKKKSIALDLDEIVCPFLKPLVRYYQRTRGKALVFPKKYPYNFSKVLNITPLESKLLVQEFYKSPEFHQIKPFPGVEEWVQDVTSRHDITVVTGRQNYAEAETQEWVRDFLPQVGNTILTNSFSLSGIEIHKEKVMEYNSMDLLIDDSISNCLNAKRAGFDAIYITGYPWSVEQEPLCCPQSKKLIDVIL